ncbi:hypothetical protein NCC49_005018 [Naganishia albida]|nr:hypothetical protein NCC49_005018 [Naganishia albida]
MVSMSSTPSTAKNEKSTQSLPKKRTADQAGLDQAIADALSKKKAGDVHSSGGQEASKTPDLMGGKDTGMEGKDVSGKDWLLDQVAKMETAFKEEAAKHYVPPVAPEKEPTQPSESAASTPGVPLSSNQVSQPQTSTIKFDASLPYIDPRTGLPSPTQPAIKIHEDVTEAKSTPGPTPAIAKGPLNGKPSSSAPNKKNAPVALDGGRKKNAPTPTSAEPNTSAGSSSVNTKFPTGSAGDPIEIDDLDIDMDNTDVDIVPLIRPPTNTGKDQSGKQTAQRGATAGPAAGPQLATQSEGIGLGLGIGEINVDVPAAPLATSDALLNPPGEDVAGDVSALLANIQNAVAATAGEAQLSEEDIMKFFETLAPGTGDGGDAGQVIGGAGLLAGNDGQFSAAGLGTTDQYAGNVQDPATNQPFMASTGDIGAETTNALGSFGGTGESAAVPVEAAENAIPEDLDLSNMDWTQYSALLADMPDENGA